MRTDLELSIEGQEPMQVRVDLKPRAPSPAHTHPGEEMAQLPRCLRRYPQPGCSPLQEEYDCVAEWKAYGPSSRFEIMELR
jgi:hypothetical protein